MTSQNDFLGFVGCERAATEFENMLLERAKPTLPQCAQDVLDSRGASSSYWAWLIERYAAAHLEVRGVPIAFEFR
jgi:hypothetical protein